MLSKLICVFVEVVCFQTDKDSSVPTGTTSSSLVWRAWQQWHHYNNLITSQRSFCVKQKRWDKNLPSSEDTDDHTKYFNFRLEREHCNAVKHQTLQNLALFYGSVISDISWKKKHCCCNLETFSQNTGQLNKQKDQKHTIQHKNKVPNNSLIIDEYVCMKLLSFFQET